MPLGLHAFDLTTTVRNYVRHLRGTASGRGGEEQVAALTTERARLAKEQADAQALKTQINDLWTAEVLPFCRKAVMNRYPLKQDSQTDATLRDFGKLFAPGGILGIADRISARWRR